MALILLHGGGDDPAWRAASLGPFLDAAAAAGELRVALVVCEATPQEEAESARAYGEILGAAAAAHGPLTLVPLLPSPEAPLTAAALAGARASGLFVCGGLTPRYHAALCGDLSWLEALRAAGLPYAGTSAGAAVAAGAAIVGGWRATRGGEPRAMLYQGASEGLDELEVRPGLGLVPGAVDAHASQAGTLLRLVHAVDLGLAPHGWAIDENTALVFDAPGARPRVVGAGHVYRVEAAGGGARVSIGTAG